MQNDSNTPENLSENVKTSFDNIVKIYEESSILLGDLVAELEKKGLKKIKGNEMSSYMSKLIDSPKYWFVRYAVLFFKAKDQQDNYRLLSITVCYVDHVFKAIEPYLIVGVGETPNFDVSKDYWWLYSAFYNDEKDFVYYDNDNDRLKIISPRQVWQHQEQEWTFKLSDAKSNTSYPKVGKLFAAPLLEIKSEDVGNLAERGANLWETKFALDADNQ